ncbi:MAG: hypothetical protein ABI700_00950 [Chloroflexota bacterium]
MTQQTPQSLLFNSDFGHYADLHRAIYATSHNTHTLSPDGTLAIWDIDPFGLMLRTVYSPLDHEHNHDRQPLSRSVFAANGTLLVVENHALHASTFTFNHLAFHHAHQHDSDWIYTHQHHALTYFIQPSGKAELTFNRTRLTLTTHDPLWAFARNAEQILFLLSER